MKLFAQAAPAPAPPPPEIRDIAPPADVFPYPLWMILAAALLLLLLVALITWLIIAWLRKRQKPEPSARETALRQLAAARARMQEADVYDFSIVASDILRRYLTDRYHLPATRQTSPEFLEAAARSPLLSDARRSELAAFLQEVDMIKFARAASDPGAKERLLDTAERLVQAEPVLQPAADQPPPRSPQPPQAAGGRPA